VCNMIKDGWTAYHESAPYICNVKWFREIVERMVKEASSVDELKIRIRQLSKDERDLSKKNDLKIYLMYLEK